MKSEKLDEKKRSAKRRHVSFVERKELNKNNTPTTPPQNYDEQLQADILLIKMDEFDQQQLRNSGITKKGRNYLSIITTFKLVLPGRRHSVYV